MPVIIVFGLPQATTLENKLEIRRGIVADVARLMKIRKKSVRVSMPVEALPDPKVEDDGNNEVYISLDTAMFHGLEANIADEKAMMVTQAIAQVVYLSLVGKIRVECFVNGLNPNWKYILDPA